MLFRVFAGGLKCNLALRIILLCSGCVCVCGVCVPNEEHAKGEYAVCVFVHEPNSHQLLL